MKSMIEEKNIQNVAKEKKQKADFTEALLKSNRLY